MKELLIQGGQTLGLTLTEEMCRRFSLYRDYLVEQNKVMNLTAITGEREVAQKHFLDSLALTQVAGFSGKRVIDVGTGAGFPGVPLKIALPGLELTLLDSLNKRIDFLRQVCDRLTLTDVECVHARAEEIARLPERREQYDYAVSRAVARLNMLTELCLPFVRPGGAFLAMKSADCAEDLEEAGPAVSLLGGELENSIDYTVPGTDVVHRVVVIRKVTETPEKYPRRFAKIQKQPLL